MLHNHPKIRQEQRSASVPGAQHRGPQPCWRFAPRFHRGCPETAPASAGSYCAYCPYTGPSVSITHTQIHTCKPALWWCHWGSLQVIYFTSRVSLPLVSSSWTFSSARLRSCSSACSRCFRVYWSQRKAMAIWAKADWEQRDHLFHSGSHYIHIL